MIKFLFPVLMLLTSPSMSQQIITPSQYDQLILRLENIGARKNLTDKLREKFIKEKEIELPLAAKLSGSSIGGSNDESMYWGVNTAQILNESFNRSQAVLIQDSDDYMGALRELQNGFAAAFKNVESFNLFTQRSLAASIEIVEALLNDKSARADFKYEYAKEHNKWVTANSITLDESYISAGFENPELMLLKYYLKLFQFLDEKLVTISELPGHILKLTPKINHQVYLNSVQLFYLDSILDLVQSNYLRALYPAILDLLELIKEIKAFYQQEHYRPADQMALFKKTYQRVSKFQEALENLIEEQQ